MMTDKVFRDDMVASNTRLIHGILNRDFGLTPADPEYYDYYEEGLVGLIKSANNFDPSLGNKFSTYACSTISGMLKTMKSKSYKVSYSRGSTVAASKYLSLSRDETTDLSKSEVMSLLNISSNVYDEMMNLIGGVYSLDLEVDISDNGSGDSTLLVDMISSDYDLESDDRIMYSDIIDFIKFNKPKISSRTLAIYSDYLIMSLGGSTNVATAIGEKYNISRQRVSDVIKDLNRYLRVYYNRPCKSK